METANDPSRQGTPIVPSNGGTIEPADRTATAKTALRSAIRAPQERYELRDPFDEVTYRSHSFDEIVTRADKLGSTRVVAIDDEGNRIIIVKSDGEWERRTQYPPLPARTPDLTHERDDESPQGTAGPPLGTGVPRDKGSEHQIAKTHARAERAERIAQIKAALVERYVIQRAPVIVGPMTIGHTEYRFRGDTSRVAFTESTFRLATEINSPSVARSMVDVAEARNWRGLRVSGNEDFRRMVWLEASVRSVKTLGYEPDPADIELLEREREARLTNRIEPVRTAADDETLAGKGSARGTGGRKAVLAAIEAVLRAKRVPEQQRVAVIAAAGEKLAQRVRNGQGVRVKVYDKNAPSHRAVPVATPELQRTRERAAPVR